MPVTPGLCPALAGQGAGAAGQFEDRGGDPLLAKLPLRRAEFAEHALDIAAAEARADTRASFSAASLSG